MCIGSQGEQIYFKTEKKCDQLISNNDTKKAVEIWSNTIEQLYILMSELPPPKDIQIKKQRLLKVYPSSSKYSNSKDINITGAQSSMTISDVVSLRLNRTQRNNLSHSRKMMKVTSSAFGGFSKNNYNRKKF